MAALAVLTVCSCTSNEYERLSPSYASRAESSASHLQIEEEKTEAVQRKIIKQGTLKFETADVNKTKSIISQSVQDLNGYISNDNANDYSNRLEHRLTVRIPTDKFDLFLENISESIVKMDSKNIDMLDVTEEYIDTEARIKTKKELQNRYRELLKHATKVDEMLNIEREIGKLQTEIESVEGRMKYLNDRIALSTLTITYYQKTTSKFGFSSQFVEGFKDGWQGFLSFIIVLSNLWVFILVTVVTVYLIRRWRRKKKKAIITD